LVGLLDFYRRAGEKPPAEAEVMRTCINNLNKLTNIAIKDFNLYNYITKVEIQKKSAKLSHRLEIIELPEK